VFERQNLLARNHAPVILIKSACECFAKGIDEVISPAFDERRRTPRRPGAQIGKILTDRDAAPRYCLVIDESADGVRVRTTPDFEVPDKFILQHASTEGTYKTVWRRGVLAGAHVISRQR